MRHGYDLIGYEVIDRNGEVVGEVKAEWVDDATSRPAYVAVNPPGPDSGPHLVPADGAVVDASRRRLRVPFDESHIRDAPAANPEGTLPKDVQRDAIRHYRMPRAAEEDAPTRRHAGHEVTGGVPPGRPARDVEAVDEDETPSTDPRDIR